MPTSARVSLAEAGKYLTFDLGDEHFGLEIMRVQEIVGMMPVTRVPRLPDYVAGVVNLRGRVIPVVDLRSALRLPSVETTDRTCIVVVHVEHGDKSSVMGLVVDEVSDVADLPDESIEAVPEFGGEVDTSFIRGVGRLEDHVVLLLDIDLVLSSSELESLGRAIGAAQEDSPKEGS